MPTIISFIDAVNTGLNYLAAVLFILFLLLLVVSYTLSRIVTYGRRGEGSSRGFFLGAIALFEAMIFSYIIIGLPVVMENATMAHFHWVIQAQVFRWVALYLTIPPIIYFSTRKYSQARGLYVSEALLTIGLIGWLYDHWIGVLFISLPVYLSLLYLVYRLSRVVLPSSTPADPSEQASKFEALFFYFLGLQFPVWVARSPVARDFERRIPGVILFHEFEPGIVWTYSHQVAAISAGSEFDQVDGPGIIFTHAHRRPVALVDLRTQSRTTELEATTKDGITFKVVLHTSFAIDHEDWPKKTWSKEEVLHMREDLRRNPTLSRGIKLDHRDSNIMYSTARVKSVLSTAGFDPRPPRPEVLEDEPVVYWDEWTVRQVENAARQALSGRTVDELWHPVNNNGTTSALDEIADCIRGNVEKDLRRVGINLISCRVVNFSLPEDSLVRQQQIDSWKTLWDERITATLTDAAAVHEEEIEKALAYAKSELLHAIAESIDKARRENPDLPRHVIAVYYIHALEEIVRTQPEPGSEDARQRFEMIRQILLNSQS